MGKYLITGSAGAGKSTTIRELVNRGYTAYDTDIEPGFSRFEDTSGNEVPHPEGKINWDHYKWNWSSDVILPILKSAGDVFFGGVTSNQADFYKYFDHIFVLHLDDDTLRNRILNRTDKDYGKHPEQLNEEIAYRATREHDLMQEPQVIAIDATQSTISIVDEILKHAGITNAKNK